MRIMEKLDWLISTNGLGFDSDSKPYCCIVLCTIFSTGSDLDSDPCTDNFPNVPISGTDLRPRDQNFHWWK